MTEKLMSEGENVPPKTHFRGSTLANRGSGYTPALYQNSDLAGSTRNGPFRKLISRAIP